MIDFFVKKKIIFILLLSFFFFIFKWVFSYFLYNEDILTKIIFESKLTGDGAYYFPFIKFISEFDLNNSFTSSINDLRNLTIPYGTILIQSILFKFFSFYGLIINEFLAIFIFIFIFYNLFNLYFAKIISLFASLFLFSVPAFINLFRLVDYNYFSALNFDIFTLRTHRPLYSNIIFYCFIYVIFLMENSSNLHKKFYIILGILLGLSFAGFYYHFIIEFLLLSFYFIYKLKKKIFIFIYKNLFLFILLLIFFLIISFPFIINIYYAEKDYLVRNGLFILTADKKLILLKYYLNKYLSIQFFLPLLLSLFILFFFIRKKAANINFLIIFFFLYLSSILAPIFFILFSSRSGLIYHFNNIVIVTFFLFIYSSTIFLINYLNLFFKKYYVFYICIIFLIFINLNFFFQEQFFKFQNFKERNTRIEFNMIIKKINEIKLIESNFNQNSFLTFDNDFQIWLILNNIKYLNINNQLFSTKTDYMIEQDIINNFKFLGLNKKDFYNFFENKIERWRVINYNVADFFRAKYTANSLSTYNNSTNFDADITEFIVKSSPIYSQQLALPKEEFIRLQKRFDGTLFNKNFNKPNFIILEKNHYVYQNIKKKVSKDFCVIFNGEFYIFYGNLSKKRFCIN
jgi:hypothetical protein